MQLILGVILFLGFQGVLDSYRMQIDPALLDSLYSDPYADYHFPALIETEAGTCSCLAGFRGSTSLAQPKKSWEIELYDPSMMNSSHILLDAQYRDLTMMRNGLGLYLTRRLGRPSPLTEHVEFYINGDYYGVYTQVERVDEYFYDRNGIGYGPIFKSIDHLGRLAWQPSDTLGTTGFEAKRGSDESLPLLRQLIDSVNLSSAYSINQDDYLAYAAVTLAIRDTDALSKNYYIHLTPGGEWRYYPWDRDATFGNSWQGVYQPNWTERKTVYSFERTPLTSQLLMQENLLNLFEDYFLQSGEIMMNELPSVIDSIYLEIQESVFTDTLKQGTNADFSEAVAVLRDAVIERGRYLPGLAGRFSPLAVESMELSEWEYDLDDDQDSVTVSIEFSNPAAEAALCFWNDETAVNSVDMNQDDLSGFIWSQSVLFPEEYDDLHFSVKSKSQVEAEGSNSFSYYPLYGPPSAISRRVCAPSARRSEWELEIDELEILSPVRYTSFLWAIPIYNEEDDIQDLSLCGFQTGDPPARVFAGRDCFAFAEDTVYLTNNHEMLEQLMPGKTIIGDFILDSPGGTDLIIFYPSWEEALTVSLGEEIPYFQSELHLNELMAKNDTTICDNYGEYDDWIEITNTGSAGVNLSGYYLTDDILEPFKFAFPDTVIQPGEYFIIWADDEPWQGSMHADFKLSADGEEVYLLYSLLLVDEVVYPELEADISYGRWPDGSGLWEILSVATPGAPNEGGTGISSPDLFELGVLSSNPFPGSGVLTIQGGCGLVRLDVYDLSGRLVDTPFEGELFDSVSFTWDASSLSAGIYFLRLSRGDETLTRKITLID